MTSGQQAESVAAQHLEHRGFRIICRNWRTRQCEIDIVAQKSNELYFFEVKYRNHIAQGSGLDYITPTKLKQMDFAATLYNAQNHYEGDYHLSAVEITGPAFAITAVLEDL